MAPDLPPEGSVWHHLYYRDGGWELWVGRRKYKRQFSSLGDGSAYVRSIHHRCGALRRTASPYTGAAFKLWAKPHDSL